MRILPRARDPSRDKAFDIYKQHNGKIDLVEIASQLNLPSGTIRGWKAKDKWEQQLNGTLQKNTERSKRNKGGQPGNKNAIGNEGGAAPKENKNAETHGFFSKYLPEETFSIIREIEQKNPLDILWENIQIAYAAIVRAQSIMFVKSKEEMIKELKKSRVKKSSKSTEKADSESSDEEYEYEFQFAWDRQATFLNAQARAQGELRSLIKQYDELLHSNWEQATEEQKLRINKLRLEVTSLTGGDNKTDGIQEFIRATKPSKEDIEALYSDEVIEDGEAEEE